MIYTFDQLKKIVGKNTKRYDDANGWKTVDTDVTEMDIAQLINEVYLNDLVPLFLNKYPQDFRITTYSNSWIASGTSSAGLTTNILTATTPIFLSSMVGLYIYNNTDATRSKIIEYTSTTSVKMDSPMTSWSSDSIFVLGKEFSFGGSTYDIYTLESLGIKYNLGDTYYRKATLGEKDELYQYGWEKGYGYEPKVYLTTIQTSSGVKKGIGLMPQFDKKIDNALEASYLFMPLPMSLSTDKSLLPVDSALISGATKRVFELKQEYDKVPYWDKRYSEDTFKSIARYVPNRFNSSKNLRGNNAYKSSLIYRRV